MTNRRAPKKRDPDWHPADIVAALRKAGWTLRKLDQANGYRPNAVQHALRQPYPKAERIIARAIGVEPHEIWPSRYDADGRPSRPRAGVVRRVTSAARAVA